MNLLTFELKKIWRQKKIWWLFLIILISAAYLFHFNASQQNEWVIKLKEEIVEYENAAEQIQTDLEGKRKEGLLDEPGLLQHEYIVEARYALYNWQIAVERKKWDEIPKLQGEFLDSLGRFEMAGGVFPPLQGMEKVIAVKKNDYMRDNNLPYENEEYPTSAHLILKQLSSLFIGLAGLVILLFFFGTTLTQEKDQKTILMLRTQPITQRDLLTSKYVSILLVSLVYILFVICLGLLIPMAFGEQPLRLEYPQVVFNGAEVEIVSTVIYILKSIALFIGALIFSFSLALFIGTRMQNTFNALVITFSLLFAGYLLTSMAGILKNPLNPFYLLHLEPLLTAVPDSKDGLYVISAFVWSLFLIFLSVYLPEREYSLLDSRIIKKPFRKGATSARRNSLWKIVVFEWRKLIRKGNYRFVLAISIIFIACGYAFISQEAKEKEQEFLANLERARIGFIEVDIPFQEQFLNDIKNDLQTALKEEEDTSYLMKQLNEQEIALNAHRELADLISLAIADYKKGNYIHLIEYQLFDNRLINGEFNSSYSVVDDIGQFTMDASIAEKQWLLKHKIRPLSSGGLLLNIHTNTKKLSREWIVNNERIDDNGLFSLYLFFQQNAHFLPLVFLLFLVGGGLAYERGKRPTISFLRTQPVSEQAIFYGKVLHSAIVSIITCLILFGIVILIGTVFDRFGDWNYPILHYDGLSESSTTDYSGMKSIYYGFQFIPLRLYLMQIISLFLVVLLFILILSQFLSIFIKSQFVVFVSTVFIVIGGFMASKHYLAAAAHLSPFTYLDINRIVNGEASTLLDNPALNVYTGLLVLVVSIVFLVIIATLLLKRRI
ncbi:ABC transporter permease subunit [Bacillus sp. REN3]|uniref:ABC transporter permease subunit n=1 Tax=Bacillus sp. REN3 TaxID=2802440 RepID=UPI001AEE4FB1|nr:ABC transporter permease subunit [Bacillus sp. REN3]